MAKPVSAKILIESARQFVANEIAPRFHIKLLDGLQSLKLSTLLKKKNPYLFKAKAIQQAPYLVKRLLDAYLSSKEETIFGDFLEALAIHICGVAYSGRKSTTEGIDLEFERDAVRYIVSIKSGPNWGNSSQIKHMESKFRQARKIAGRVRLEAVNGCCYGRESQPERGDYRKLCGQDFWELITGIDEFYLQIVEPLGHQAKTRTDAFDKQYDNVINQFSSQFINVFCHSDGAINWDKLIEFNSGRARSTEKP